MKNILLLALGIILGVGLTIAGGYYTHKERHDKESVKIYRTILILGVIIALVPVMSIILF